MRALIIAAGLALCAAPAFAQDAAEVVAAERAFAADAPSMGIAGSFNKWSMPDAIVIAGGQAQRIDEAYPDGPRPADEPLLEWWPNFAGVAASGDLGFTTGGVALNGERAGHYFTVWKRQPDGSWKWVYDGGPASPATDVAGPETEPVVLPVSTAPAAPNAEAEVRAIEEQLSGRAALDQKAAHLTWLAPQARLYVARQPPADDPEAHARALDAWPVAFEFGPAEGGGASSHGDLVWGFGPAGWTQDGQQRSGHWVRLWQRQAGTSDADGGWRIVVAYLLPAPLPPTG